MSKNIRRTIIFAAAALAVLAGPAYAIDFTTSLHTISGGPFKDDKGQPTELLLGTVAENSLLSNEQNETGEVKAKAFWLAVKLHEKGGGDKFSKDVTLTVDEIKVIKDKIGKLYPPSIVGAAWMILDPASVPK